MMKKIYVLYVATYLFHVTIKNILRIPLTLHIRQKKFEECSHNTSVNALFYDVKVFKFHCNVN